MYVKIEVVPLIGRTVRVEGTTETGERVTLGTLGVGGASGLHTAVARGEMRPDGWHAEPARLGSYPSRDEALAAILAVTLTPHHPGIVHSRV